MITYITIALSAISCTPKTEPENSDEPAIDLEETTPVVNNADKISIEQGVWGEVIFVTGDMTSPEDVEIELVSRAILIYKPTSLEGVEWVQTGMGAFIAEIKTEFVDSTVADEEGFYELELPVGEYSVFAREGKYFWANHWNTGGILANLDVYAGRVAQFKIKIDYEAER